MEKRKRAMMMMEEQPTFAQLYLHVGQMGRGGVIFDRDGLKIEGLEDDLARETAAQAKPASDHQSEKPAEETSEKELILPERSLYVTYKAFPSLEKLVSTVMYG